MTKDLPPFNPRPPKLSGDSHRGANGGFFVTVNNQSIPLPINIICEALELDPTSQTYLRWRVRPISHFKTSRGWRVFNSKYAGKAAGNKFRCRTGNVYFQIGIGGKNYQAHRVVYAIKYGFDPGNLDIDHMDNNGLNNSPENLRLATRSENMGNRGKNRNNTSGKKGVYWHGQRQKWMASIKCNGRAKCLGLFASVEEASDAYQRASLSLFGEFHHQPQHAI
jgi:hypothetical protein